MIFLTNRKKYEKEIENRDCHRTNSVEMSSKNTFTVYVTNDVCLSVH